MYYYIFYEGELIMRIKTISLIVGIAIAVIGTLTYFVTGNLSTLYWICGIAGGVGILLSGVLIGAFLNGSDIRGNYFSETKDHRDTRTHASISSLLFSIPNILVLLGFYFF